MHAFRTTRRCTREHLIEWYCAAQHFHAGQAQHVYAGIAREGLATVAPSMIGLRLSVFESFAARIGGSCAGASAGMRAGLVSVVWMASSASEVCVVTMRESEKATVLVEVVYRVSMISQIVLNSEDLWRHVRAIAAGGRNAAPQA